MRGHRIGSGTTGPLPASENREGSGADRPPDTPCAASAASPGVFFPKQAGSGSLLSDQRGLRDKSGRPPRRVTGDRSAADAAALFEQANQIARENWAASQAGAVRPIEPEIRDAAEFTPAANATQVAADALAPCGQSPARSLAPAATPPAAIVAPGPSAHQAKHARPARSFATSIAVGSANMAAAFTLLAATTALTNQPAGEVSRDAAIALAWAEALAETGSDVSDMGPQAPDAAAILAAVVNAAEALGTRRSASEEASGAALNVMNVPAPVPYPRAVSFSSRLR